VTAQVVRRLRLPADHSSPGIARAAVRSVVADVDLGEVLDEALLLTTELATNAVVHARTELDVEIVGDTDSLTVTVMDFRTGPISHRRHEVAASPRPVDQIEERGRGLLLVDQLATYWGTLHYPEGKGVWFRLDRIAAVTAARGAGAPVSPAPAGAEPQPAAPRVVNDLVGAATATLLAERPPPAVGATEPGSIDAEQIEALVEPAMVDGASIGEIADRLLAQLCRAIGAAGGAVVLDRDDGQGPRTLAGIGSPVPLVGPVRVALPVVKPWRGELILSEPSPGYARALIDLTAERIALTLENDRLRRTDSERRTWLTYLAEVSELLAQSLDAELTLALIPRLVVPRLGPWCAVHIIDDLGELRLAAAAHIDEGVTANLADQLAGALPELHEALQIDAVVPLAGPVDGYASALVARNQPLGTLSVGRTGEHPLTTEELAVIEDVGRRSALAIDNARIHAERRAIAEALQRSLLPPTLPRVAGIEFGAEYVPTGVGVDVGGDFYDVMALADDTWLVVVGDVSGKGIQAAAVTGLVRDVTRVLVRDGRPLPETLGRLNETLVERGGGRFCTLALAAVTPRAAGQLDVSLYLAGHDRPVLLHADGTTSLVGSCGTALGLLNTISSPRARISLDPGDTLVFYTDGVTERRRGPELYGVERLRREAATLAGFPAEVVAARLRAAALGFSSETPRDDIAIFALRNDLAPT
jgi:sigma-B regulation protein RsbU (phosphoserine phosphatase)